MTKGSLSCALPTPRHIFWKVCAVSSKTYRAKLPHLVAVNKDAQDMDLVNQGLDGSPAADAEAEDKVVGHTCAVEEQDRVPASSPAAMHRGRNIQSLEHTARHNARELAAHYTKPFAMS